MTATGKPAGVLVRMMELYEKRAPNKEDADYWTERERSTERTAAGVIGTFAEQRHGSDDPFAKWPQPPPG